MSKPKVARKAPKKALLPLESLKIRQVEDFSGRSLRLFDRDAIGTYNVALALDFLQRMQFRRLKREEEAWIDSETVTDRLHTLRKLIQGVRFLSEAQLAGASAYEMSALMGDMLEYLTIRAELAGDPCIARERRYRVTVDAPALAVAPKRQAVA